MNRAILVGNLTRDPELRATNGGVSVCTFTIAINRRFANANGEREADFIPIVVWRAQAENCARYLHKGSKVAVNGTIQTRSYDAQDGSKRYVTEVVADDVEFLTSASSNGGDRYDGGAPRYQERSSNGGFGAEHAAPADMHNIEDDDLPF